MSKVLRVGVISFLSLMAAETVYGHGPRYFYGSGPSVYVQPRVIVAPQPAPIVVAPAPVPAYAYPAPVYVSPVVPVYAPPPPPPVVTYGAIGPRGHVGVGYSSPGFGFYFGR